MIIKEEKVDTFGTMTAQKEVTFGIKSSMMGHVMKILSNMYSDPSLAVAREYISNAVDAHRAARKAGLNPPPMEVKTPSTLDPVFEVRDYGKGMSAPDTMDLLSNFGASGDDKRSSDDAIGGFGIGSKCAFAVCDSFNYTVWHGGYQRTWLCTVKGDASKALQLLLETPSDEPTGVKVSVPIPSSSVGGFYEKIDQVRATLPEPILLDGELLPAEKWDAFKLYDNVELISRDPTAEEKKSGLKAYFVAELAAGDFTYDILSSHKNQIFESKEIQHVRDRLDKLTDLFNHQ
jgi:hypothetical protein